MAESARDARRQATENHQDGHDWQNLIKMRGLWQDFIEMHGKARDRSPMLPMSWQVERLRRIGATLSVRQ